MCVIAAVPAGHILPSFHLFSAAWNTNPDGAGFMYPDPALGSLVVVKGLMSFSAFKAAINKHRKCFAESTPDGPRAKVDVCVHFRIRSHGPINADMTHPFLIPGHPNVAIAHNGIISGLRHSTVVSDTVVYIEDVLSKLPKGWQKSRPIRGLIERDIGPRNKVVVMDESGIRAILNRSSGVTDSQSGVWWSNDYHLIGRPAKKPAGCVVPEWAGPCDDACDVEGEPFPLALSSSSASSPAVFNDEPPAAPAPARRGVVRQVSSNAILIREVEYDHETGEMTAHILNHGEEQVVQWTMEAADAIREAIRNGDAVSECQMRGKPSFLSVYTAMKEHHDATR